MAGLSRHDLRAVLRSGDGDDGLDVAIRAVWEHRADRYSELRTEQTLRLRKVEMSDIGGRRHREELCAESHQRHYDRSPMGFESLPHVVALVFVLATAGPASALLNGNQPRGAEAVSTSEVVVQCPAAGIRYIGTTAQGFALCLTRSRDGRRLLAYLYGGVRCPGVKIDAPFGWAASRKPPAITIRGDGSFTHKTTGGKLEAAKNAVFAGKFVGSTRVTGTLRAEVRLLLGGTCNTGKVRWSARRS